ncbi:hypothetical protein A3K64_02450 [Candidatus Micrarchaeota archaeon RBG_16_36_9]|nr:MAG: hypothetical protein A3K64_02450 [Candidatus Micrarchaeota archaeon RBG_16_36_9]
MITELVNIFLYLINNYGYLGLFLANIIASSTIVIPLPIAIAVFASGSLLNPLLVALSSGFGAAIGEFVGYAIGTGSRKVIERKWKKWMINTEKLFQKYGGFWIIILFAATPLPDDIVGIVAGTLKYPIKKFFIASLIGKIILNLILAYAGFYGLNWILHYFGN